MPSDSAGRLASSSLMLDELELEPSYEWEYDPNDDGENVGEEVDEDW